MSHASVMVAFRCARAHAVLYLNLDHPLHILQAMVGLTLSYS